ncbi:tripartite ATP-independent transporter DctM subunit [Natronocella acetinitrilica]|uniref:Tripartite ATP-independent transporter DctM subunit n=1 Tax=Natronocella acetinitrilica TaxID=414046 RepID=A0AAE3K9Z9_9GAMM|nr:TRAP transporter large permease [Natronocella acetinitrilica]MCP1673490.1 tripartite ATP-independent transporter DctM subunit [Natronocella acetinitrilica]
MDPLYIGLIAIGTMLLLIALSIPVAFSIFIVAIVGLWYLGGMPLMLGTIEGLPYQFASQYGFVVIPMFILMGAFAEISGITKDFYTFFYRVLGRVRGGLLMVTTLSSAGFAAISGSTMVNAVVFTRIALPQMMAFGYNKAIAAGCIAAAGTFAALIPPSIMMVVYALLTGQSIGTLLVAGIVPGLLTAGAYLIAIWVMVTIRPSIAPVPTERFSLQDKLRSFYSIWPFVLLAVIVIGGIYSGAMFPSSAGAVGAVGAFLIMLMRGWLRKDMPSMGKIGGAMQSAAMTTAVLFLVIIAGLMLSRLFVYSGFVDEIVWYIEGLGVSPLTVMLVIMLMYIILGCFMDTISMVVVTVPFVFPVVTSLGFDPIWFGVIVIKLVEIGVLTPPIGLNLFAVLSASDGRVQPTDLFKGVAPFLVVEVIILGLLLAFPAIVMWLPDLMRS